MKEVSQVKKSNYKNRVIMLIVIICLIGVVSTVLRSTPSKRYGEFVETTTTMIPRPVESPLSPFQSINATSSEEITHLINMVLPLIPVLVIIAIMASILKAFLGRGDY